MIEDRELEERLLSYVVGVRRKSMFVIASVFEDIGHRSRDARLWGSGDSRPDALVDRSIHCMEKLSAEGRIQSFGDLSKPQFSEIQRDLA